jgi:hypothetical protein
LPFSIAASLRAQVCQIFLPADPDLDVDGHALFHGVFAARDPFDGLGQVRPLALGQESDVAEVDAEQRHVDLAHQFRRAEDGPVTAKHHHEFDVGQHHVVMENFDRLVEASEEADHVAEFGFEHHGNDAGVVEAGARFPRSLEGLLAACVGKDQDAPAHRVPPSGASSTWARLFRVTQQRLRPALRS